MKIKRSTKCTLKYLTDNKRNKLSIILDEYCRVVNNYIDLFWNKCPHKMELKAPIINSIDSWFTHRLKKVAAREAIDLILTTKRQAKKLDMPEVKPKHAGRRICLSSTTIVSFQEASKSKTFDVWLHLHSIGNKTIVNLPIKLHQHFHKLDRAGKRLNSYIITKDYVQFVFEIETGPKKEKVNCIGIDTGINALATLHNGKQIGTDIKRYIENIKRKQHGSKGQKKARRSLKQRIDEVAKETVQQGNLVVVEKLKNITKNTKVKRRLNKNMRRSIGSWNVSYWLMRLQQQCEWNRVSFRTVSPYKTSVTCSACGHANRRNRSNEKFLCQKCDYADNADVNAAKNILGRFLTGPYGAGCKPKMVCF